METKPKKAYRGNFMIRPLLSFSWSSINSWSCSYNLDKGNLLNRILNFLVSRETSFKGSSKTFEIFPISVATSKRLGTKFIWINQQNIASLPTYFLPLWRSKVMRYHLDAVELGSMKFSLSMYTGERCGWTAYRTLLHDMFYMLRKVMDTLCCR